MGLARTEGADDAQVRIGVLGAARIVDGALLKPSREIDGVAVTAIAARDRSRAADFARRHGLATVNESYEHLLEDPAIDAVYIPLPAALHAQWSIAAIAAGKHVLCEKPFTRNADDAGRVASAAAAGSVVVMEAYHSHYHPLTQQLKDIVASGEIG